LAANVKAGREDGNGFIVPTFGDDSDTPWSGASTLHEDSSFGGGNGDCGGDSTASTISEKPNEVACAQIEDVGFPGGRAAVAPTVHPHGGFVGSVAAEQEQQKQQEQEQQERREIELDEQCVHIA
jgi:hypothetical protein